MAGGGARRAARRPAAGRGAPTPTPGPGQLLRARCWPPPANFPDVLLCRGEYQVRPELPFTPGVELCGEVVAVGAGVTGSRSATGCWAPPSLPYGGFAEHALMDAATTFPRPPALDDAEAAALHIGYQTGWFGLHRRPRLRARRDAAGARRRRRRRQRRRPARQGGRRHGSSASSAARRRPRSPASSAPTWWSTGASEDFVEVVKAETGGRGADVVYDPVGGDTYQRSTKCIAFEGRILVVGFAGGADPARRAQPRAGEELLDRRPALGPVQPPRPGRRGPSATGELTALAGAAARSARWSASGSRCRGRRRRAAARRRRHRRPRRLPAGAPR